MRRQAAPITYMGVPGEIGCQSNSPTDTQLQRKCHRLKIGHNVIIHFDFGNLVHVYFYKLTYI